MGGMGLTSVFVADGSVPGGGEGADGGEGGGAGERVFMASWDPSDPRVQSLLFPATSRSAPEARGAHWGVVVIDNLHFRHRVQLLKWILRQPAVLADWILVHDAERLLKGNLLRLPLDLYRDVGLSPRVANVLLMCC